MNVHLRPQQPGDDDFVYGVYASTRQEEVSKWGWEKPQQEAFLRMQFMAQTRWYEAAYAGAEYQVVLRDEQPIGRMIVLRAPQEFHLIDISLLPKHQSCGIGTELLTGLIIESRQAGMPLRLQVLKGNRAVNLYQRLGFSRYGEDEMYYRMQLNPG